MMSRMKLRSEEQVAMHVFVISCGEDVFGAHQNELAAYRIAKEIEAAHKVTCLISKVPLLFNDYVRQPAQEQCINRLNRKPLESI